MYNLSVSQGITCYTITSIWLTMFKAGVGIGEGPDDYTVGVMAVSNAVTHLRSDGSECVPQAAILFAASKYDYDHVIRGVRSVLGEEVTVVGCSTAGEITQAGPAARDSVVLMLLSSDSMYFSGAVAENLEADTVLAGQSLVSAIQSQVTEPQSLLIMFPDGLSAKISTLITSIKKQSPEAVLVGGAAGDHGLFDKTVQYFQDQAYSDSVTGLGVSGNVGFSVAAAHGWNPIGAPRTVTEAIGSKVVTIDDKPALNFYRDYLGEEEAENLRQHKLGEIAVSYPVGMYDPESQEPLLRAPLRVEEDGSIVFGGNIPTDTKIQLMMGSREDAIKAARQAAQEAMDSITFSPQAAIIFSCHVRNTLFSGSNAAEHEISEVQSVIGEKVPMIGFYTYSEQAPVKHVTNQNTSAPTEFHNETIVVVLLGEKQ